MVRRRTSRRTDEYPQPVTWSSPHQTPATEPRPASAEVRADRGPYDCQPRSMAASQDRSGARLKPLPRHDNRVPKADVAPADADIRGRWRKIAANTQVSSGMAADLDRRRLERRYHGGGPAAGLSLSQGGPDALWFAGRSAGHAPGRSGADHNVTVGVHGKFLYLGSRRYANRLAATEFHVSRCLSSDAIAPTGGFAGIFTSRSLVSGAPGSSGRQSGYSDKGARHGRCHSHAQRPHKRQNGRPFSGFLQRTADSPR